MWSFMCKIISHKFTLWSLACEVIWPNHHVGFPIRMWNSTCDLHSHVKFHISSHVSNSHLKNHVGFCKGLLHAINLRNILWKIYMLRQWFLLWRFCIYVKYPRWRSAWLQPRKPGFYRGFTVTGCYPDFEWSMKPWRARLAW